jgi:glucose uptake protein GlcU
MPLFDMLLTSREGSMALGVIWALTIVAVLIVMVRCYAQKHLARAFGLSDALAVVASVSGLPFVPVRADEN